MLIIGTKLLVFLFSFIIYDFSYVNVCVYVCIYIYIYIYMCVCVCVYVCVSCTIVYIHLKSLQLVFDSCVSIPIIKVQVKCTLYRPGVAQRVGRGIALLFHDRNTRRG